MNGRAHDEATSNVDATSLKSSILERCRTVGVPGAILGSTCQIAASPLVTTLMS